MTEETEHTVSRPPGKYMTMEEIRKKIEKSMPPPKKLPKGPRRGTKTFKEITPEETE